MPDTCPDGRGQGAARFVSGALSYLEQKYPAALRLARLPGVQRLRRYRQLAPIAVLLWALDAADKFRAGAQTAGLGHARAISQISRQLGGSVAVAMNHWTSSHPLAAAPATACYIVLHVLVTGTVGVLLLRSGHASFPRHRNALIGTGVTGLVVFWAYPVAPHRPADTRRPVAA